MTEPFFDARHWPGLFVQKDPRQRRRLFLPVELQQLQMALQEWLRVPQMLPLQSESLNHLFQSWQIQPSSLNTVNPDSVNQVFANPNQAPELIDLLSLLYAICLRLNQGQETESWQTHIQTLFLPGLQEQEAELRQEIQQIYLQGLADTKWHFLPFVLDADVLVPKTLEVRGSQITPPERPLPHSPLKLPVLNWWSWNPFMLVFNRRYLRVLRQVEARFGSLDYFFKQFSDLTLSLIFNYMLTLARNSTEQPLEPQITESWKQAFRTVFQTDYTQIDQIEAQAGYLSGQYLQDVDLALDLLVAAAAGLEKKLS